MSDYSSPIYNIEKILDITNVSQSSHALCALTFGDCILYVKVSIHLRGSQLTDRQSKLLECLRSIYRPNAQKLCIVLVV
jgi:hypothetical protein